MRTDRLAWSQVACDNLKKAGATDEIFYYRRVLGKEKYAAHVFIAQYASQEQLKQHWESLNDNIALLYQSNVDSLLERSNFYLCFFLPESLDIIEKEKIENDAYCAKKYIFVSKKELSIEEKIRKINEKIFELTYLEPQDTSETKLISMQVQNFRIYKGQKNFAFTAENSPDCPASLVMIYAPNGMGKTSICDALEWALTGRIQRLSDMEKLIGRSNMLLHNREKYKSVEEYRRNKEYALVKLVLRNRAGAQDELQRVVRRNANDLNVGTFKGTLEGREKPFQNELHWNQIIKQRYRSGRYEREGDIPVIDFTNTYDAFMHCDVNKLAEAFASMYHSDGEECDRLGCAKQEVNEAFMRMKTITPKVETNQSILLVCKDFGDTGDDVSLIKAKDLSVWKGKHKEKAETISDEMLTFMSTDDIMDAAMQQELPTRYAIELCSWDEILGWKLAPSSIYIYGLEFCLSRVLWEMTFFGIEPHGVEQAKADLDASIEESKKNLDENGKPHGIPFEDFVKELLGDDYTEDWYPEEEQERDRRNMAIASYKGNKEAEYLLLML